MSTTLEIAKDYAAYFVHSTYKNHAANHIVIEISCLHYKETLQSIPYEIKAAIVDLIEENMNEAKSLKAFRSMKADILKRLEEK